MFAASLGRNEGLRVGNWSSFIKTFLKMHVFFAQR